MARSLSEEIISNHALLRWLERVKGFDIKALRNEMLAEFENDVHEKCGPFTHTVAKPACIFVFEGSRVVTVLAPDQRPHKRPSTVKKRDHT